MSYVFFDTETTGLSPQFDQIIQFAAIKTDENFQEVDRINVRCRVQPHIIPSPIALAVSQTPISLCFDKSLPTHYEMMLVLKERLEGWSPAVFSGWNSISFDEEFLRYGFYQSLLPSYLTSFFSNARLDILKIAQAAHVFEPGSLIVPTNHNGNNTFSLDPLSRANGHTPTQAHDALSDVQATIFLAKLLKTNAPLVWSQAVRFSKKASVVDFMNSGEVCITSESYKGRTYQYPVVKIGEDPGYAAFVYVADVTRDYSQFLSLSLNDRVAWLKSSPQPIRKIKANASPMLMPLDDLDEFQGMDLDAMYNASQGLMSKTNLCTALSETYFTATTREFDNVFVEQQLYDRFADHKTEQIWHDFHAAPWENRWKVLRNMLDARYKKLGIRLINENNPANLPENMVSIMQKFVQRKPPKTEGVLPPWRTVATATQELVEARVNPNFTNQSSAFDLYEEYLKKLPS